MVTPEEMIANVVRPIDVPNCAIVLKTAPARPCVLAVNESAMIKFATVKMTGRLISKAISNDLGKLTVS